MLSIYLEKYVNAKWNFHSQDLSKVSNSNAFSMFILLWLFLGWENKLYSFAVCVLGMLFGE